jgi:hypothetical protein
MLFVGLGLAQAGGARKKNRLFLDYAEFKDEVFK